MNLNILRISLAVIAILLLLCIIILSILLLGKRELNRREFYMIKQGEKYIIKSVHIGKKRERKKQKNNYYQNNNTPSVLNEESVRYNSVNPLYSISELNILANRILQFCTESTQFLDKDFKHEHLVNIIGSNRNYTSQALNKIIQLNFNQLKNYYRICTACEYFILHPNISIEELYTISKFASFSSFVNSFDKYTNFSPNKWCKDVTHRLAEGERVTVDDYIRPIRIKSYHNSIQ